MFESEPSLIHAIYKEFKKDDRIILRDQFGCPLNQNTVVLFDQNIGEILDQMVQEGLDDQLFIEQFQRERLITPWVARRLLKQMNATTPKQRFELKQEQNVHEPDPIQKEYLAETDQLQVQNEDIDQTSSSIVEEVQQPAHIVKFKKISDLSQENRDQSYIIATVIQRPNLPSEILQSTNDYFFKVQDETGQIQLFISRGRVRGNQIHFKDFYESMQLQNCYKITYFDIGRYKNKLELRANPFTQITLIKEQDMLYSADAVIASGVPQDVNIIGVVIKISEIVTNKRDLTLGVCASDQTCIKVVFQLFDEFKFHQFKVGQIVIFTNCKYFKYGELNQFKSIRTMSIYTESLPKFQAAWDKINEISEEWLQHEFHINQICQKFICKIVKVQYCKIDPKTQELNKIIFVTQDNENLVNLKLVGQLCNLDFNRNQIVIFTHLDIHNKEYFTTRETEIITNFKDQDEETLNQYSQLQRHVDFKLSQGYEDCVKEKPNKEQQIVIKQEHQNSIKIKLKKKVEQKKPLLTLQEGKLAKDGFDCHAVVQNIHNVKGGVQFLDISDESDYSRIQLSNESDVIEGRCYMFQNISYDNMGRQFKAEYNGKITESIVLIPRMNIFKYYYEQPLTPLTQVEGTCFVKCVITEILVGNVMIQCPLCYSPLFANSTTDFDCLQNPKHKIKYPKFDCTISVFLTSGETREAVVASECLSQIISNDEFNESFHNDKKPDLSWLVHRQWIMKITKTKRMRILRFYHPNAKMHVEYELAKYQ